MRSFFRLYILIALSCALLPAMVCSSCGLAYPELDGEADKISRALEKWVKNTTAQVESRSEVIDTPYGPIEYVLIGPGAFDRTKPIVLSLHGGFGGFDQGELIVSDLVEKGWTILAPSRPGYLRTPLSVGQTIEEQADAMIGLLDALGISKVAVLGFSAGAPVAFQLALRHPDRAWALVLECLGAQPNQSAMYELLAKIITVDQGQVADFGSWLFYLFTKYNPINAVKFFVSLDNDLSPAGLRLRTYYVTHHRDQLRFALKFILTTMPMSPRSAGLLNDIGSNLDLWPTFPYSLLITPTMIIQARHDDNGSYPEAQWVASQIPGSQFVTVEDSGHFIWLGPDTRRWERILNRFLEANDPS